MQRMCSMNINLLTKYRRYKYVSLKEVNVGQNFT